MQTTRLVILDDDSDDLLLMKQSFGQTGSFDVVTFDDVDVCLHYLQTCPDDHLPHVVITDLNMPKRSGLDFIRLVKQSPRLASIYLIVCSTSSLQLDMDACRQTGAADYFVKPGTFKEYGQFADKIIAQMLVGH